MLIWFIQGTTDIFEGQRNNSFKSGKKIELIVLNLTVYELSLEIEADGLIEDRD